MAIGASYATLAELRFRLGYVAGNVDDDPVLTRALDTASRAVETYCDRQFNDAGSATARVYFPDTHGYATVDDFSTTTGLVIKTDGGNDGTYETTWSAGDFYLTPLNGVVDGEAGRPYDTIHTTRARYFPCGYRPTLEVTARWGWAAVPAPVKEACIILAHEIAFLKDAPLGVAGYGDYGPLRVKPNPKVMSLLNPYRRTAALVA